MEPKDDSTEESIEVLPPQPVALDALVKAAQPLVRDWAQGQRDVAREETARLKLELDAEFRVERLDFVTRYTFLLAMILVLGALIAFGLYTGETWMITHVLAALAGGVSGYGLANTRRTMRRGEAE